MKDYGERYKAQKLRRKIKGVDRAKGVKCMRREMSRGKWRITERNKSRKKMQIVPKEKTQAILAQGHFAQGQEAYGVLFCFVATESC